MFEELRNQEFFQLNTGAFADFGGSCPISQSSVSRIEEYANDLFSLYPSSTSLSPSIDEEIDSFRNDLLSYFNTDSSKYQLYFSSNTSTALRALGFAFPWGSGHKFIYHIDNHNSVLGIRNIVSRNKGEIGAVQGIPDSTGESHSLFAYVPQSNFNGKKYPLEWINEFQQLKPGYAHVLVDCAAFSPSCKLDLSQPNCSPDFVVISLLKMFGVGGGAILVRNDAKDYLNYFPVPTFDKMSIVAAYSGMKTRESFVKALGDVSVSEHVYSLAKSLHSSLKEMKHYNGKPLVELYPSEFGDISAQGGTVAFNLLDSNGNGIPHDGIFTVASANNIFVRFGVHCNPGATYTALKWETKDIQKATEKHEAACSLTASKIAGKFVGSIRVSFGYISSQQDVDLISSFIGLHFIEKVPEELSATDSFKLEKVFIHPIKGCQGVEIKTDTHRIVRSGLWCDENWGVADEMSTFLDRRRCPRLATLKVEIVEDDLNITSPEGKTLTISVRDRPRGTDFTSSTVCHEKINGKIYDPKINQWFTDVLGQKAVLVRFELPEMKPFRAFFTASLDAVGCGSRLEQLKPHFIFKSETPFAEDAWAGSDRLIGDDLQFQVTRLLPINTESMIDCETGGEVAEPLHSICLIHGVKDYPKFGLELIAKFVPSRKNPKELKIQSTIH